MFAWLKRRRRDAVRATSYPAEWQTIIEKNVPYVACLPPEDRAELMGHVQVLLAEKHFEGCGGLELTDEIRVTIAAQAAVLLLHRPTDYYSKLVSILVYPSTYLVPGGHHTAGLVSSNAQARLGESWSRGTVVLAWDSVRSGAADIHDAHNLVLHEFAHQLDQENASGDGTPVLPKNSMYVAWGRVLGHEFDRLVRATALKHKTIIDRYGATNPAEFFAVVTEAFFEKPRQLREKHPALYDQLQQFYCQDPAALGKRS